MFSNETNLLEILPPDINTFELLFESLDFVCIFAGIRLCIILYKGDITVSLSWGSNW